MKVCSCCKQEKDEKEFGKKPNRCKECDRRASRWQYWNGLPRLAGISWEEYEADYWARRRLKEQLFGT